MRLMMFGGECRLYPIAGFLQKKNNSDRQFILNQNEIVTLKLFILHSCGYSCSVMGIFKRKQLLWQRCFRLNFPITDQEKPRSVKAKKRTKTTITTSVILFTLTAQISTRVVVYSGFQKCFVTKYVSSHFEDRFVQQISV